MDMEFDKVAYMLGKVEVDIAAAWEHLSELKRKI